MAKPKRDLDNRNVLQCPGAVRDYLKGWYYAELNQHPPFRLALTRLFLELQRHAPDWNERQKYEMHSMLHAMADRRERPAKRAASLRQYVEVLAERCAEAEATGDFQTAAGLRARTAIQQTQISVLSAIGAFCDAWPLPPDAPADVWRSKEWWWVAPKVETVQLTQDSDAYFEPDIGIDVPIGVARVETVAGVIEVNITEREEWVFPNMPLPFRYNPLHSDRAWLNEQIDLIVRDIRDSILAQAEAYEEYAKQRGWKPIPPHYRRPDRLRLLARRMMQKAVLGMTWDAIADGELEAGAGDNPLDADAVRKVTVAAAKLLSLKLT